MFKKRLTPPFFHERKVTSSITPPTKLSAPGRDSVIQTSADIQIKLGSLLERISNKVDVIRVI